MAAWKHRQHGFWDQFLAQKKGMPLSHMPSWKNGGRCHIFPNPSSRRKAPNTHACYLPVAVLPLECSAIKPQLIKRWLTRKATVFHCMAEQVESWLYLKVSKHGIHSAQYVIIYWKTVSIYLITPFVEKELCPSQYNFNWYLRHLILIQLLGILVQKKMAELNSLWYSCLILIYLFLTSIHNLLSTSLLWLNRYCWNNHFIHSSEKLLKDTKGRGLWN